ncbi:ABC transporter ATP-binding protein [Patescibacteria group bacterium]|nr:ABC transporter ATP-binding protein [Patescibacteria group bacterium]MBU1933656.1 ABC transporter ATP-binding protein [Patescibacteria group bacterium]MBU2263774.1 ABC transporter ATP-binding protein [Patescibacteria group bacterium]
MIEVKNLGKKYNITHQQGGYVALRDVLTNVFKNPFSFAKHKVKQITGTETKEEFWAVKNVNFTVEKGEAVGIIGANGAGKSTLLKILTGITPPTTGEAIMRGKTASLLEVGTGFHPELTGRENIFFNGAILGMTKKEIIKKFDQIVDFAGVKKFLDTPVKHYSSGMNVRLAFAVAAHLEPDILIIDEVLAVGDADFQKKCLGKMDEITKKDGRTILFVSHNMEAIQNLCDRCLLLNRGKIKKHGPTNEVIDYYLSSTKNKQDLNNAKRSGSGEIKIKSIQLIDENNKDIKSANNLSNLRFLLTYNIFTPINSPIISVGIYNISGNPISYISSFGTNFLNQIIKKDGQILFELPNYLSTGNYKLNITIHTNNSFLNVSEHISDAFNFNVSSKKHKIPYWVENNIFLPSKFKIL